MCGIAAIFNYRNGEPIDRAELTTIRDAMALRGPDGFGDWVSADGCVGLGHRRLSIIDLSPTGAQPMKSADGSLVVTFNGEIYNYRELRSELEQQGQRFQSTSDTEVLLHLYQREGREMVRRLRGMFAFAIWDSRRQGLFMARDPFGIKPLYYADDGKTLRVASQVKALLAGGHVDTSPEPAGHVGFFLWGYVPSPFTLCRGIRGLSAGVSLWLDRQGNRQETAFSSIKTILAEGEARAGESASTVQERKELLHNALRESIQHHMIADVPVGIFLSAGVDSTAITALASETTSDLRTVTLAFEEYRGTPEDESALAAEVAASCGARHQAVWVTKRDFRENYNRVMQAMDQPSCDGINSFFVSYAASLSGIKVALSGLGGDELFGGYPSFLQIPSLVRYLQPFSAPAFQPFNRAYRLVSAPVLKRLTSPKYAGLFEYGGTWGGAYLLRRGLYMPWELPEVLDPDLARQGWDDLQPLARLDKAAGQVNSPHLKVAAMEMTFYMRQQLLRDVDWASMNHSLEVRTPLVDAWLLRALAPAMADRNPPGKRDLALAPERELPAAILNRPKTGFTVPVRKWLVEEDRDFNHYRGLRGWTRLVYNSFLASGQQSLHLSRASLGTGKPARGFSSDNHELSLKRILVFRIGQLGDTIAALPAFWALRNHFPGAEFTLLCDRHAGKNYVLGSDLLRNGGFFQRFEYYPAQAGGQSRLRQVRGMLKLVTRIRKARFDAVVYLAPSARTRRQIARDVRFFRTAGIKRFIGMEGFASAPARLPGQPLDRVPHEADLLMARLAASGIPIPPPGGGCMDLATGTREEIEIQDWLGSLPPDGGRPWIGFGTGTKMPAKQWPLERFLEVGKRLIAQSDVWPVVFGGPEDADDAARLVEAWGRGYNAAGSLSLRAAAAALKRCILYVGNDTGTMHLAASAGTPCVAIFSARDWPGRWNPYGPGHHVLRAHIDCEGCGLTECIEHKNECLRRITVEEVIAACGKAMEAGAEKRDCETTGLRDYGTTRPRTTDRKTTELPVS